MNFDPMTPIWLQVAVKLKQQIVTGCLAPGDKLPGGRDLALQYGINPNTAARIYQELEREGICVTRRGLGTYVTEEQAVIARLRSEMARQAVKRFMTDIQSLGLTKAEALELIQKEDDDT
ncbi:MAG: GntR family transcriptional regulator [Clostridia bacterium]|nr:GntR family transcriptional regulator [Clostridia bacterium]